MSTSEADWTFNKLYSICVDSAGGSITFYVKTFITNLYIIIVGTSPPLSAGGEGVELRGGVAGKERGDRVVAIFT